MQTRMIGTNSFDGKKQTVNKSIKICVNCGNTSVQIGNYEIFCKECGAFFNVREVEN